MPSYRKIIGADVRTDIGVDADESLFIERWVKDGVLLGGINTSGQVADATGAATSGGGGAVAVKDEGSTVVATATAFDFVGAGVTASDGTGGRAVVTIPGGSGGALSWTATKTANYTAVAGNAVPVDTTGGAVTITLPASPAANDLVRVALIAGTAAVTVAGTINGQTNWSWNSLDGSYDFSYTGSAWRVV